MDQPGDLPGVAQILGLSFNIGGNQNAGERL